MLDALVAEARLRWGFEPAEGLQVVAAEHLLASPVEASRPVLLVPLAVLRAGDDASAGPEPLPGRAGPGSSDSLRLIRRLYPSDHPVGRFGSADGTTVASLEAGSLAAPLYFPPVAPELALAGPWAMPWISARLRRPDGCPWDREQTLQSLRPFVLEETYELLDTLDRHDLDGLREELGDFLFEAVFLAQIAEEGGHFAIGDAIQAIADKLVRRHPHVFTAAGQPLGFGHPSLSSGAVIEKWEDLKSRERATAGAAPDKTTLSGVPRTLPALLRAYELSARAAAVGFDWVRATDVLDKIDEEVRELRESVAPTPDAARAEEEMGDLLFSIANLSRKLGIEPESALRRAADKFQARFETLERQAVAEGHRLQELTLDQLEARWQRVKSGRPG